MSTPIQIDTNFIREKLRLLRRTSRDTKQCSVDFNTFEKRFRIIFLREEDTAEDSHHYVVMCTGRDGRNIARPEVVTGSAGVIEYNKGKAITT